MALATIKLSEGIFILFSRYSIEPPAFVSHAFIAAARILLYSCIDWWLSLIIRSAFYFAAAWILLFLYFCKAYAWSEGMNNWISTLYSYRKLLKIYEFTTLITRRIKSFVFCINLAWAHVWTIKLPIRLICFTKWSHWPFQGKFAMNKMHPLGKVFLNVKLEALNF